MLRIITVVVTPFQQNARFLFAGEAQGAMLVDPGGEVERLFSHLPVSAGPIEAIVLTHAHIDHGGGVAKALALAEEKFGKRPTLYAYGAHSELRQRIGQQAILFGLSAAEYSNCPEPDCGVAEDDVIEVGGFQAQVLFTPGHAPDHISLYLSHAEYTSDTVGPHNRVVERGTGSGPLLLGGDTLFAGSIGRTDLPGGDHDLLLKSIRGKLMTLPDETRVLTGHGPDTTIAAERAGNPFLR
ncbi:MAG: MBL fold metallo-hydrolase [Bdellovibrionales bacterium]|nr:MBL fold metallo-hydrolase [Bdellovibrionales bacterium]